MIVSSINSTSFGKTPPQRLFKVFIIDPDGVVKELVAGKPYTDCQKAFEDYTRSQGGKKIRSLVLPAVTSIEEAAAKFKKMG